MDNKIQECITNDCEIRLTWISLRKSIVETNWLFIKPPDDRQLSMNCEGLGLDRGLAPTKPQYVATSELGICHTTIPSTARYHTAKRHAPTDGSSTATYSWCNHLVNVSVMALVTAWLLFQTFLADQWVWPPVWSFPLVFYSNCSPKMHLFLLRAWRETHRQTHRRQRCQGSNSFERKKSRSFPVQFYNFPCAFGHSSHTKYIKYETFIIDVYHSFLCNTN